MYIGNDLQIAHPSYKIIDDISSGFNGSTTSFALQVSGATPVPFPISTQQVMISVNGVVQEPDPNGNAGFKLLGSNIVFSSAPANGHAFFGVINAGADYVTAGSEFPDGSATAPSFTFQDDQDTGWFRSGSGAVGYSANGVQTLTFDGNGLTVTGDASFVGDSAKNLLWDKSDGQLEFADNAKATFGTSADLSIYHNGSHSYVDHTGVGDLWLRATSSGGDVYAVTADNGCFVIQNASNAVQFLSCSTGSTDLYHNGTKKLETTANGITVSGGGLFSGNIETSEHVNLTADNKKLKIGAGEDLQLWHDGSHNKIECSNGQLHIKASQVDFINAAGSEYMLRSSQDGAVELYYDNSRKLRTTSTGIAVDDNLDMDDNHKVQLGSSADFKLYHNGTNSYIDNTAGELWLRNNQSMYFYNDWDNEYYAKFIANGAVELFHNGTKTFETTSAGVTVTGTVTDSKGDLRSIPKSAKTANYTLVAADGGKCITMNGSGLTLTVPHNTMTGQTAVTIINHSANDLTIAKTASMTLYNSADGTNANRTLAARGMATIYFEGQDTGYISGAGLS